MSADHVRSLGLGTHYTKGDKTWSVSPWTFGIQGEYCLYLQDQTLQRIRKLEARGILTAEEAREQKRAVPKDRDYIFGSKYVMESMQESKENLAQIFWLCVSANDAGFTLARSRQLVEEDAAGVIEAVARANTPPESEESDPNRETPANPGSPSTSPSSAPS